ncbi:MAG: DinB family protein [bacterium]|nr:DinB family protein [bacterium]
MPKVEISDFRAARERTSSLVAGLSEEEMAQRPAPGTWSPGELVDHLLRTEGLWRGEVEELLRLRRSGRQPFLSRLWADFPLPVVDRLPAPLLGILHAPLTLFNTFVPTRFFLAFLRFRRVQAKAPPAIAPRQARGAEDLRRELRTEAAATVAVFEDNEDVSFRRLVYQHPLFGIAHAVDLLRLITAHEKRHQDQLVEILTDLGLRGRA